MYLAFYDFCRPPFFSTPDPELFFTSPSHQSALAKIIYGIEGRKGLIAITGEVGVGKTTVLRTYLSQPRSSKDTIIYVLDTQLSFADLMTKILRELSVDARGLTEAMMADVLQERLLAEQQEGRTVVLFLDEAHHMPIATLERLWVLSNLETATEKLLQIVLVGQPELENLLQLSILRQMNQRIALRARITALSEKQSAAYIRHRITKAGAKFGSVFTEEAYRLIVRYGKGIPRRINVICDNALIAGYTYKAAPVSATVVRHVLVDIFGSPSWKERWLEKWFRFASTRAEQSNDNGKHKRWKFEATPKAPVIHVKEGSRGNLVTRAEKPDYASFPALEKEMCKLADAIASGLGHKNVLQFMGSQDGVGTVTILRAFSSAVTRLSDRPILLVDTNVLDLHRSYGIEPGYPSLDLALRGNDLDSAIMQVTNSQIYLAALSKSANQAPLCHSGRQDLWGTLRDRFMFILIAAPPIDHSAVGLNLCSCVDGVILVIEAEGTSASIARDVRDHITKAGGNLLGIVLNKQRHYIPDWIYARV